MSYKTDTINVSMDSAFSTPSPEIAERIRLQPECHLLWAVMQRGIEECMKYATATDRRGRRLHREATDWLMRDDYTWLYSFINICHILGLDPGYVREGLERWCTERQASDVPQAA